MGTEEKSLLIDTNQIVGLYIPSEIDDSNLQDPHGYSNGMKTGYFNRKIIIENTSHNTLLENPELIINNKSLTDYNTFKKYLKLNDNKSNAAKNIYTFWKDNVFHATSRTEENKNPFYLLNYWGYGLCGDTAVALTTLFSYLDIPARRIHLNGHHVYEYFFDNKWNIIDANQNIIYINLDNVSLSSFKEIIDDPFIALRTKVYGKYNMYNAERSWNNMALFEFVESKENSPITIDKETITDLNRNNWFLCPGEKIIFHYNQSPEVAVGKADISAWNNAKEIALGEIELLIDVSLRRRITQSNTISVSSKYPIYKIVDHQSGKAMYIPKGQICTQFTLKAKETSGQLSVFCQGARYSFPILSKGRNAVGLKSKDGNCKAKVTFNYNLFPNDIFLPKVHIKNPSNIFKYEPPFFVVEGSDDIEKMWWQICDERSFQFIIPNFDCVQDFSERIELSEITNTFFRNNESYYFRIKAMSKGVWGEWSSPFQFNVIKPDQPEKVNCFLLPEGKIKIAWHCEETKDLEYLIFGSNRLDFIPDIYVDKQVNKITNGIVEDASINKNLLMTTSGKFCVLDDKYLFYRIVARKDCSFSTPSSILSVHPPAGNIEPISGFPKVLQDRHSIVYGNEFKNGYKDIHEAKEMNLPTPEERRDMEKSLINRNITAMYRLFGSLPIEAQEFFVQKIQEYMEREHNTSYYVLNVFRKIYAQAMEYGVDIENSSILEIGAGQPLGTGIFWNFAGAKKYTSIDKFVQINLTDSHMQRFETILDMNLSCPENFRMESLVKKNGDQYILNEDKISLIQGSFETYPLEKKSFDFIYSNAVLEHVTNIEKIAMKMYDVLADDGVMIHQIDLREHHTNLRTVPDKNTSIDFLRYSTEEWNRMYPPGSEHYINRLRASDFQKYFKDAGFSIVESIATQEMELDEMVYSKIHPEFHRYSIDDLRKIGIRLVLKKNAV